MENTVYTGIPFREQYEKLVTAYMNNKVNPWDSCACFIGNLLNGRGVWVEGRMPTDYKRPSVAIIEGPHRENYKDALKCISTESKGTYTASDIYELEGIFLTHVRSDFSNPFNSVTEESLFKAFEITLQRLREIHESKGEVIEDYDFKRRESAKALFVKA